jgi:hypothetical protein
MSLMTMLFVVLRPIVVEGRVRGWLARPGVRACSLPHDGDEVEAVG